MFEERSDKSTKLGPKEVLTMTDSIGSTINLVNSVIGVSLLSMPFCFKKCGIILSIVLIVLSNLLNRFSCYLLLKSAIIAKRRNYELLAFHSFGSTGKLLVELSVLGFLLGTCIAFFVVIGDIGPSLVSQIIGVPNGPQLRALVMTFLGMFVALPLGLLRRVDSLTSFSMLSLILYLILVLKMVFDAMVNSPDNMNVQINYWNSSHALSSLPIFSMALSCQTQLFAIFDSAFHHNNDFNTLRRLNATVNRSLNICSAIYISVGISGYIAFSGQPFGGNILLSLPSSFLSTFTLIAFVFTVLVSFPLCLFPCRTSLHSLLSRKGTTTLLNTASPSIHMSDHHFRLLTVVLIVTTIGISILLPYIEFVLGILGSTIGAVICFIFPALIYLNLTSKNTTERLMAQFVVITGAFILIICSLSTLHDIYFVENNSIIESIESSKLIPIKKINEKIIETENQIKNKIEVMKSKTEQKTSHKIHPLLNDIKVPLPSIDANKAKRQEELLQRLERQQIEHKKLLEQQKELFNEMKKHNQLYHNPDTNQPLNDQNIAIPSNFTDSKNSIKIVSNDNKILNKKDFNSMDNKIEKKDKIFDKPFVYLSKPEILNNISVSQNKSSNHLVNKINIKDSYANTSDAQNPKQMIKHNITKKHIYSKSEPKVADRPIDSSKLTNISNNSLKKEI